MSGRWAHRGEADRLTDVAPPPALTPRAAERRPVTVGAPVAESVAPVVHRGGHA
jgi:hypothetical protein